MTKLNTDIKAGVIPSFFRYQGGTDYEIPNQREKTWVLIDVLTGVCSCH